jgi:hypothetical protein
MKTALWIFGVLLTIDVLYLSHFYVFQASYYFPDRYEDAIRATINGLLFGLPLAGAFVALLVVKLLGRKKTNSR